MHQAARQVCFVDMPFGRKNDPGSGVEIDFDQVYEDGIAPAVVAANLQPIRGDQEQTGGVIHAAMFARLLLAEFVIADMTIGNANVFYELGVRHAAKPYTTIPIFATLGAPPFDVNMVRAIPYDLEDGRLTSEGAAALGAAIQGRIDRVLRGPVAQDSPIFALFPGFPGIEMSHELTDVFRDRVEYSETFRDRLAEARATRPLTAAAAALDEVAAELGDLSTIERGVLIDLLLSYRDVEAFEKMVALVEAMPAEVREAPLVRQQLAFGLNRRKKPGDRRKAIRLLETLIKEHGESAETLGLLGRVHKDLFGEAKKAGDPAADGHLEQAIAAYVRGFEAEPADFYPGVNAITLLLQKGDDASLSEVERLAPLVTFAAVRRGGERASDYWTVATVLELAAASRDYGLAERCLPRVLALVQDTPWMLETTAGNLRLIADRRSGEAEIERVAAIADTLMQSAARMKQARPG